MAVGPPEACDAKRKGTPLKRAVFFDSGERRVPPTEGFYFTRMPGFAPLCGSSM